MFRPPSILAALLCAVALAATGCQALGQALGVQPRADAPAYHGVGVVVLGHDNDTRLSDKADQSGAVGASGTASQTADMTQEIPAEAIEALVTAAKDAIAAGNPAAAAAILSAVPTKKPKPAATSPPGGPPAAPSAPMPPPDHQ